MILLNVEHEQLLVPPQKLLAAEAAVDVLSAGAAVERVATVAQECVGDEVLVVVDEVADEDLDAEEVAVAAGTGMVLSVDPG